MEIVFHYPPELLQLLVDTIPLLCRSKKDVLLFFRGAGVRRSLAQDLWQRVEYDRERITKYEIVRVLLTRLNERGEATLAERREVLKRVVEFEDFSTCWPSDQLKAKGLVAEIRRVVHVKDSFTRMNLERKDERKKRAEEYDTRVQQIKDKQRQVGALKRAFFELFSSTPPATRGSSLESILNRLFDLEGILVRESFRRTSEKGPGVIEQIDGVIELEGEVYLVEMKWLERKVSVDDVSRHLVRIYHRGSSRGIFISATQFTAPSLSICREALQKTVVILVTLEELVHVLETNANLRDVLKRKVRIAIIEKDPFRNIIAR